MSEINAIATNNYILHNIDAKKLYVQEPLFTANSGDAVYVGWRPDETVLWSGYYTPTNETNITFTEPVSAFNKIKFVAQGHYSFIPEEHIFEFSASVARTIPLVFNGIPGQGGIRINSCIGTFSSNYMRLDIANCRQHSIEGANTTIITGTNNAVITKVVGINRKENA